MTSNNYNYPEITRGLGELTPSMWSRLMDSLRHYETHVTARSAELSNESLNERITDLELHKPYFFAKLLRAHVLDHDLQNPNIYEYAWVEVRPTSTAVDCCPDCIESRIRAADTLFCCSTHDDCETYLNLQGHWNWWEYTTNTSWGSTLANNPTGAWEFEPYDLTSDYNPLQYPCFAANASSDNCDPEGEGGFPNINRVAYTKPALNILEAFNTYDNAGGVDHTKGVGDFMLQTIGGGDTQYDGVAINVTNRECWDTSATPPMPPCTQYEFPLKTTPIVLMHNIRESGGTFRQVFSAANAWDGTCVTC